MRRAVAARCDAPVCAGRLSPGCLGAAFGSRGYVL